MTTRGVLIIGGLMVLAWEAHGFGGRERTVFYVDPCWPVAPMYVGPVGPAPFLAPAQAAGSRLPSPYIRDYAVPSPAPPSTTPIQPQPGPNVIESRSVTRVEPGPESVGPVGRPPDPEDRRQPVEGGQPVAPDYDAFYFAPDARTPLGKTRENSAPVSFWNLSERSVMLRVNGQSYRLRRGQQASFTLPRQFQWQIEQREPIAAEVPSDRRGVEIVIRR
jgi:hypothetical protein